MPTETARGTSAVRRFDLLLRDAGRIDGGRGDLGIRAGKIEAVGSTLAATADVELQLDGRIILPGFVEAHTHLDKALTVSLTDNLSGTLYEAVELIGSIHRASTVASIRERASRAAEMFISSGVTTMRTHVDITPDVGMKCVEALLQVRQDLRDRMDLQLVALTCTYLGSEQSAVRAWTEEALRLGVDVVGGAPVLDLDPRLHIDHVFSLAERFARPVDLHVDESDNPADFCLPYLAAKTIERGWLGRVVAGHCCSLAAVSDQLAESAITRVAVAGIAVVTLPSANMYLQGRSDRGTVRRGITRVRELMDAGVLVACGSDNVQDPFNPFGRGDPLLVANLFAHAAHLGSPRQQLLALETITRNPASALGLVDYGLEVGCAADIVVLEHHDPRTVLAQVPPRRYVIKRGRVVAETVTTAFRMVPHAQPSHQMPA